MPAASRQVGDLEGHALLAADRTTEWCADPCVLEALVEAGLDQSDGQGGDGHPAVVEVDRNLAKPRPGSPSRFSSGTRQSMKVNGWVSEVCQPILR